MSGSVTTTFSAGSLSVSLRHVFRRDWSVVKEFAVDASLIAADANKQRSIPGSEWIKERDPETASRAVKEYMATLDDAAFGAATKVTPKFVSPSDPAAQWTGAMRGPAFFAYSDNYLIDVKVGIIMDVEASRAIRQAEVGASKTMIERTQERFDIKPERLAGDTAYGSGANLNWLVNDKDIAPHIPVIDKSKREDGTFSREDFTFDKDRNVYICPAGKILTTTGKLVNDGETLLYRTRARDCRGCLLKAQCCPKTPVRKIPRSIYEEARDVARALAKTEAFEQSRRDRKRVEMLFAHFKRILRLGRLRLRGPCGAQVEFTLAAIAQNLRTACQVGRPTTTNSSRCVCCVTVAGVRPQRQSRLPMEQAATRTSKNRVSRFAVMIADFCNKIGTKRTRWVAFVTMYKWVLRCRRWILHPLIRLNV